MSLIVGVYGEDKTIHEIAVNGTTYDIKNVVSGDLLIIKDDDENWKGIFASNKWAYIKKA